MGYKNDVRWKQRFQNFRRAFLLLRQALEDENADNYSDLECEGVIQRFEYTFELAWKTWKDYLEHAGVIIEELTPRKVIKECTVRGMFAAAGIDPEIYLDMMLERNLLSHIYDFDCFQKALNKIKKSYFNELDKQYFYLLNKDVESDGQHWP
jgi:nucleotidyltransferase substrate binding protein (TIGR01987 family)